jgi:hypothetical protein
MKNRITIMDKKVGWATRKGKDKPRMIDIYFKPVGENEYDLWCEYCNSNKCEHVTYALSIPHISMEPLRKKGWKYRGETPE